MASFPVSWIAALSLSLFEGVWLLVYICPTTSGIGVAVTSAAALLGGGVAWSSGWGPAAFGVTRGDGSCRHPERCSKSTGLFALFVLEIMEINSTSSSPFQIMMGGILTGLCTWLRVMGR